MKTSTLGSLSLIGTALAAPMSSPNVNALTKREGINCRGSGLCDYASFTNSLSEDVAQGLRDAMYTSSMDDSVTFNDGDHIICVSSSLEITISGSVSGGEGATAGLSANGHIGNGGVCAFMQNTGGTTTFGTIKQLADKILEHGCNTCGSCPTDALTGGNDDSQGELTFNYVGSPYCVGNCISAADGNN